MIFILLVIAGCSLHPEEDAYINVHEKYTGCQVMRLPNNRFEFITQCQDKISYVRCNEFTGGIVSEVPMN
jgi:hypothetical protein